MSVSPTTIPPDFHLTLTDQAGFELGLVLCDLKGQHDPTALGEAGSPRTATRVAQGGGGYDDFKEPFTPILQSDFSAGRGNDDFTKDSSRYCDSEGIDSSSGEIILAPRINTAIAGRPKRRSGIKFTQGLPLYGDQKYIAYPFTAGALFEYPAGAIFGVTVRVRYCYGSPANLNAAIHTDNSGTPGAVMTSQTQAAGIGDNTFLFQNPVSLTLGTTYFVVIGATGTPDANNHYELANDPDGTGKKSGDGATWATLNGMGEHELVVEDSRWLEFEYKGALYAVEKPAGIGASRLFLNGYRGLAQANGENLSRIKTGLTLTVDQLVGKTVKIVGGPGYEEEIPWRRITASTTDGICTVNEPWKVAHTTATEFVILGCDEWNEISDTGLTKPVTAVEAVDDIVYLAQGDSTPIRRFRALNNAGTWTNQFENDGTAAATFLRYIADDTGINKLWKANATTSSVQSAVPSAWGTPNTWGTEIFAGNKHSRITGVAAYGNPSVPWILKEDSFGSIRNDVFARSPNSNLLAAVKSDLNGRAFIAHDVYLYFSLRNGLQRYYDNHIDDVGPDRDEGLPGNRQGPIVGLTVYPGRYFATVDAGLDGYSALFVNNLMGSRAGWHELYRAPLGERLGQMTIQVIPGASFDRLWFREGNALKWLPVSKNPKFLTDYPYVGYGYFVTPWYYTGYRDVVKYWDAITIFAENLSAGHQEITVDYQTDNETAWHALAAPITSSPSQRQILSADRDVSGKRIRFRITLTTDDPYKTPHLKAILIDGVTRIAPNKIYNLTFLVRDAQQNLNDQYTNVSPEQLKAKFEAWSDSAQFPRPLKMHSCRQMFDDQWVFVEPASWKILSMVTGNKNEIRMVGMVTLRGL